MVILTKILILCAILGGLHIIGVSPQFDNPKKEIAKLPNIVRYFLYLYAFLVGIGYLTIIYHVITIIHILFLKN